MMDLNWRMTYETETLTKRGPTSPNHSEQVSRTHDQQVEVQTENVFGGRGSVITEA